MKKVTVYSFEVCPFCVQAKMMLDSLNVEYTELIVSREEVQELSKKSGMLTVPQIFVEDTCIGGFTDLAAKVRSGEFQGLING